MLMVEIWKSSETGLQIEPKARTIKVLIGAFSPGTCGHNHVAGHTDAAETMTYTALQSVIGEVVVKYFYKNHI